MWRVPGSELTLLAEQYGLGSCFRCHSINPPLAKWPGLFTDGARGLQAVQEAQAKQAAQEQENALLAQQLQVSGIVCSARLT